MLFLSTNLTCPSSPNVAQGVIVRVCRSTRTQLYFPLLISPLFVPFTSSHNQPSSTNHLPKRSTLTSNNMPRIAYHNLRSLSFDAAVSLRGGYQIVAGAGYATSAGADAGACHATPTAPLARNLLSGIPSGSDAGCGTTGRGGRCERAAGRDEGTNGAGMWKWFDRAR